MTENKIKGLSTELQCQLFFTQLGYNVSVPLGEDCRYDMIVDLEGILLRVQVKHATINEKGITISTKSAQCSMTQTKNLKYSKEEIDYFATFYDNNCYLIKVEECSTQKTLAFEKTQQSQNYIKDYLAEKEIKKILNGEDILLDEDVAKVYQYDLRNNLVGTYLNAFQAAESLGDRSKCSHISKCLKGQRQTAYGYKWSNTLLKS